MDPITIGLIITTAVPLLTTAAKKLFKTEKLPEQTRQGVHALLPVLIGVATVGVQAYASGASWVTALALGLGAGGAASSVRDIDKNLIGLAQAISGLLQRKPEPPKA